MNMSVITAEGCVIHRQGLEYNRTEAGRSFYACPVCKVEEFENEDTGHGG